MVWYNGLDCVSQNVEKALADEVLTNHKSDFAGGDGIVQMADIRLLAFA